MVIGRLFLIFGRVEMCFRVASFSFFFLRFKPRMTGFGQSERSFALLDLLLWFRVNQDIVEMDGERWSKCYFT